MVLWRIASRPVAQRPTDNPQEEGLLAIGPKPENAVTGEVDLTQIGWADVR